MEAKFGLGKVLATPGALEAMSARPELYELLARHQSGDWGDLSKADRRENDRSLKEGFRILSAYTTRKGVKVWVITEADRSSTTVLLPEEY